LQAVQPNIEHAPMVELDASSRASDYLAFGLTYFNGGQRLEAINAFSHAIATGDLNNQGRALAYWHLFLSHREESLDSHGAEALSSFVTIGRMLQQQASEGYDGEDLLEHVKSFIERFELNDRILLAEVTLEALWAKKDNNYGRTPERPVLLGSARAQRLFLNVFKPCVADDEQEQKARVRIARAAALVNNQIIDEATIQCPGAARNTSLFFTAP
jgi:hypothetical protein